MTRFVYMAQENLLQANTLATSVRSVLSNLSNVVMLDAFATVATTHGLSAPVVATMRAVPNLEQAMESFPNTDLFNVVPEGKSSAQQKMGLESLDTATCTTVSSLGSAMASMVKDLGSLLTSLPETLSVMETDIVSTHTALVHCDLDPSIEAYVQVSLPSEQGVAKLFDLLESHISALQVFNVDQLLAYPDQVHGEVEGLALIVADLSSALGICLTEHGIGHCSKGEEYISINGGLEDHGIDKNTVLLFLDKCGDLCQVLQTLASRREEIMSGLSQGIQDTPSTLDGNTSEYGACDHIILMTCHVSVISKLIEESLVLIGRVVNAGQSILERHQEYSMAGEREVVASGAVEGEVVE